MLQVPSCLGGIDRGSSDLPGRTSARLLPTLDLGRRRTKYSRAHVHAWVQLKCPVFPAKQRVRAIALAMPRVVVVGSLHPQNRNRCP